MSNGDTTLSIVLHGESGVGKSWLGGTAPAPRLILDIEGRAKHIPYQVGRVFWDPKTQNPPVADGSWDTCVVSVLDYGILDNVYQWLRSGQHGFKSVVVDSLMEAQKRFIDSHSGLNPVTTQDWGVILRTLESFVRNLRDLIVVDAVVTDGAVLITGSKDVDGKMRPLLQGQLASTLPYYVDVVGYYFVGWNAQSEQYERQLLVQPTPQAVAKDGTGRLGNPAGLVQSPNLTTMYNHLSSGGVGGTAHVAQEVTVNPESEVQAT